MWNPLLRIAGIAAILFVLSGLVALLLYTLAPPPVSGGAATLRFIADNKGSYIAQQLLWLVPSLFGLVVFVALVITLFTTSPGLSVLGFAVGAASWTALLAVPVTSEGTLSLVYLSDQYSAATTDAARASFVAAAEALIAQNNTVSLAGVLTPLGILLMSLPMVRGTLPRWAGWLGIVTGGLGLVSEASRFSTPTLYAVYGPLLWVWFAVVGVSLLRLSHRGSASSPAIPPTAVTAEPATAANSMTTITGSIHIECPVGEVFDFVADERNEPAYNPRLAGVEKTTPGPIGNGTRWHAVAASGNRATPFDLEITEYTRPTRLASVTHIDGVDISGVLTFAPDAEGTRMNWTWNLRPKGALKLASPLLAVLGRKQEERIWSSLKTHLEQRRQR